MFLVATPKKGHEDKTWKGDEESKNVAGGKGQIGSRGRERGVGARDKYPEEHPNIDASLNNNNWHSNNDKTYICRKSEANVNIF